MSSRVRLASADNADAEIVHLLEGTDTVIRLVDPSHHPPEIDESQIPADFTGVLVATSGSTGSPKTVMLSRRAMIAAAEATHARLGGPGAWANPLPTWYVAGLMTRVRAIVAGMPHHDVSAHLEDLPRPGTRAYLSLVPAQLHRCLSDHDILARLTAYEAVLIGGMALDAGLRHRAEQAGVRIVTTYGMSETCGGVVYDDVPLDPVSVQILGLPTDAPMTPDVDPNTLDLPDPAATPRPPILTEAPQPTRPASSPPAQAPAPPTPTVGGRIVLTTPTLFDGYVGNPTATAQVRHNGSFLTSDRGRFDNGRLTVLGRVDEVVQSGGVNVDLAHIQRLLDRLFPHAVACFATPDPVWGSTVLVASTGPSLESIRHELAPLVGSPACPRGIVRVDALPLTSSGKIDRAALTRRWTDNGDRA
ncbi:MAG: AMP-binding protein [Propionibacteriaceae bacterium]|nr:AMP-binding protein [Propionibacteriaceae bacterium]